MTKIIRIALALAIGFAAGRHHFAKAQDASAAAAYKDIEQTLGFVPGFFKAFPKSGIAGAWAEFKIVQLNPKTALDVKTKELIGLAVAAQVPCAYCVYFHTAVAKAQWRDRGRDQRGSRHGLDFAALEHSAQRHADRSRRLQARDRYGAAHGDGKSQDRQDDWDEVAMRNGPLPHVAGAETSTRRTSWTPRRTTKTAAKIAAVNGASIKQALETRDGHMLTSFYADDAVLRIVDRNNPPSKAREVKGKAAIGMFWDDICSRAMTHKVETSVAQGDATRLQSGLHLSRRNEGAVPRRFCDLKGGKIARQTVVQAWDE